MGLKIEYVDGQTPLDEDETEGLLIKSITTRGELDEFEQQNIERAIEWTLARKFKKEQIISEDFVKELHKRMLNDVWAWAGEFRKSEKNIGVKPHLIGVSLKALVEDSLYWVENGTYSEEEIAVLFKHRIVNIHCFANGNGRHSRLIADVIVSHIFGKPVFSWGRTNLVNKGNARTEYLTAIRAGDGGNIQPLVSFAKAKKLDI
jgi:Fic-DOC domain mobile mystery protein B